MFALPLSRTAFSINTINDGYNAKWDDTQQEFVAPIIQTNFSKCNRIFIECYDTFETINNNLQKKR